MRDQKDRTVAPYDLWQTSMMANSARDPFWLAVLSAEIEQTPAKKAELEEKCTRCHAPMAAPAPPSPDGQVLTYLRENDERSQQGLDGVSCTVCHQITEEGLGTAESFTGHFQIGSERLIFGPHRDPVTMPMQRHVNYTPTHAPHILRSALCATCHSVVTSSVDPDGQPTSHIEFHEQSPYLEWRNSDFNDEVDSPGASARSCQACHMPIVDIDGDPIATRLAHNPGGRDFPFLNPRQPFGRHVFLGGNTLLRRIFRDHSKALGVQASASAFDQSIELTQEFLATQTAKLELHLREKRDKTNIIRVSVENLAGHKLPSGYPSRRVWIMFTVADSNGAVVFASGGFNPQGQIVDRLQRVYDSEQAGGPIEPHHMLIASEDDFQAYESIMGQADGAATFSLLRGATFLKDNRLLPAGWRTSHEDAAATRPQGIDGDSDFVGGHDHVDYQFDLPAAGSYTVTARLWYQVISPRHAAELFAVQTPEVQRFQAMYQDADRSPDLLGSATLVIDQH